MKTSPRLYLGTMTFAWSQTSSKVDERIATEMVSKFAAFQKESGNSAGVMIDTARIYAGGKTEPSVAQALAGVLKQGASTTFGLGTKAHPSQPGGLSKEGIQGQFQASSDALGNIQFGEYYLHQPDPEHSLLESLTCLHEYFLEGRICAVGMSNYHASEMERAFALCEEHGLTPPTVYQGLYNPLNRLVEGQLLPVLRKNNCAFVAYNPLAAGLLTGKYQSDSKDDGDATKNVPKGRFKNNQNYLPRFYTEANFEAVQVIRQACQAANLSMVEATYRWLLFHSGLDSNDGVLLGASSLSQLDENLAACRPNNGELPSDVLRAFEEAWRITQAATVFPYWRSYSSDHPNRANLDQGASYSAAKKST